MAVNIQKLIDDMNNESKMRVVAKDFSMATKSYDIFLSGCTGACPGCHNTEAWDFNQGTDWKRHLFKINEDFKNFKNVFTRFFILGGEPLEQDHEHFMLFMTALKEYGKEMWLFTRFSLAEVPDDVKELFDYIKCGPYLEEYTVDNYYSHGVKLATSNQKVYSKADGDF